MDKVQQDWDLVIKSSNSWSGFSVSKLWRYKDLLGLFIYRDFVAMYKQTILGPLWYVIQPILTTITYYFVFGRVAGLSTDGVPKFLFYLAGVTCWSYFAACLNKTSNTFSANANLFGKVYFPRILVPVSNVVSNLIRLGIQIVLFLGFLAYFLITTDKLHPNATILLVPYLFLLMAVLGMGMGILISSLTTKYRDLQFFVTFGVQLLMFLTPVIYPLSSLTEDMKTYALLIPMTSVLETFKYAFTGVGFFSWWWLLYTTAIAGILLVISLRLFGKIEKRFMDTV